SGRAPVDHLLTDLLLRAAGGADTALAGVDRLSHNIAPARPWPAATERRRLLTAYAPRWYPRFLLYERRLDLPRVAAAALRG
ncbi:hypothetical protein, partial [Actinacidiphila bryophytorum]|uniref:hypothetical protein n=1 Tax=Actinacidiphila bryophytorum TaxID=1436133 RepID=UPI00197E6FFB